MSASSDLFDECIPPLLTELNLSSTNVRAERAGRIVTGLATNTTFTTLHLSGNDIGDEGARRVATVLAKSTNTTLTTLNLSATNIGDEGAGRIATALATNSTLTRLDLYCNNIGEEGAGKIVTALATNTTLTILNLPNNKIGVEGSRRIATALARSTNTTLTTLDLSSNHIGDEGARRIATALAKSTNTTLTTLDLRYNHIDDSLLNQITQLLKLEEREARHRRLEEEPRRKQAVKEEPRRHRRKEEEARRKQAEEVEVRRRTPFIAIFERFQLSVEVRQRLFQDGLTLEGIDHITPDDLKDAGVPRLKATHLLVELKTLKPFSSSSSTDDTPSSPTQEAVLPDLHIPFNTIHFEPLPPASSSALPTGATASVRFGTLNHREQIAIKKFNAPDGFLLHTFQRELSSWNRLRSAYIVTLYGYSFAPLDRSPLIIMERMIYSLRDRLNRSLFDPTHPKHLPSLTDSEAHTVMEHIALGLAAVHTRGMIHRDLKADNVLISLDGRVAKLADFGYTRTLETMNSSQSITPTIMGTPGFMAPELFEDPPRVSDKLDIYSFGMVLYEIIDPSYTGHGSPYCHYDSTVAYLRERHGNKWRPPKPSSLSSFHSRIYPLVNLTMHESPDDRPNTMLILNMLKMAAP